VTKGPIRDVAASVRQRLLNRARATNRPFQELLQYFAMERFLYRLSLSRHASRFILKGALMFTVWRAPASRPTKDIDLLGRMPNTIDAVVPAIRDVCNQAVEPDGLVFHPDSVVGTIIKEEAEYSGVRVTFQVTLQNARVAMQIDVGFGDVITPAADRVDYPTVLDFPTPRLLGYNRETAVAEKLEAMVKLGLLNSRMKDFYDLWLVSRLFEFDGIALAAAVAKTFANRGTDVDAHPFALTPGFATDRGKQTQWTGFLRKSRLTDVPAELQAIIDALGPFLLPVVLAVHASSKFDQVWIPPGPWQGR
jgi:hypothetical protein